MHIGLIGGIGPAATEFYYRGLVRAHAQADRPMELTIVHAQSGELVGNMLAGAAATQARVFARLVERLQAAGAEAAVVTSIAGHFCIEELIGCSPLPVIDAIPELRAELGRRGLRRIGLLGTRVVMQSGLYGALAELEVVVPSGPSLAAAHDNYLAMAIAAEATAAQRDRLFSIGLELCERQEAEVVVLAGTDLFLAFDGRECGFPVLDSARVHIDAVFRESLKPGAGS